MAVDLPLHLFKPSQDQRIGVSFIKDEDEAEGFGWSAPKIGALVRALHPYGIATNAGLRVGDRVLTINGEAVNTSLAAAAALRDAEGNVAITVRRPPADAMAAADQEDGLSRRLREMDGLGLGGLASPRHQSVGGGIRYPTGNSPDRRAADGGGDGRPPKMPRLRSARRRSSARARSRRGRSTSAS